MIRFIVFLLIAGALAYCGATVKLGKRTFFGHVQAIWKTDEVRDMKQGFKEKAGPTVNKVKRGVEKGIEEVKKEGSGSAGSQVAPAKP
ncbi:MAG: hypothetical protein M4D80_12385 [Myxococcota bacterium]|nr:hypothetical protein [Myxococcota bacterium]